jgi:hypothetical protein
MRCGKIIAVGMLLLLLVLAACGDDEETGAELEAVGPTAGGEDEAPAGDWVFAGVTGSPPGELALPAVADADGALLFQKAGSLFLGRFDGSDSVLLAELAHPYLMTPSPDGQWLLYLSGQFEEGRQNYSRTEFALSLLNLATQEDTTIMEVGSGASVGRWPAFDPDGRHRSRTGAGRVLPRDLVG